MPITPDTLTRDAAERSSVTILLDKSAAGTTNIPLVWTGEAGIKIHSIQFVTVEDFATAAGRIDVGLIADTDAISVGATDNLPVTLDAGDTVDLSAGYVAAYSDGEVAANQLVTVTMDQDTGDGTGHVVVTYSPLNTSPTTLSL